MLIAGEIAPLTRRVGVGGAVLDLTITYATPKLWLYYEVLNY